MASSRAIYPFCMLNLTGKDAISLVQTYQRLLHSYEVSHPIRLYFIFTIPALSASTITSVLINETHIFDLVATKHIRFNKLTV